MRGCSPPARTARRTSGPANVAAVVHVNIDAVSRGVRTDDLCSSSPSPTPSAELLARLFDASDCRHAGRDGGACLLYLLAARVPSNRLRPAAVLVLAIALLPAPLYSDLRRKRELEGDGDARCFHVVAPYLLVLTLELGAGPRELE
jgi:hypothetical protein